MKRKEFLYKCGIACVGSSIIELMMQGCVSSKSVSGTISGDFLLVSTSDFEKDGKFLKYLVINNKNLQYPIYLFRISDTKFSALYMQCSHQGNELSAFGEKLVCSAHGSEFDMNGNVTNGPASEPLRNFQVQFQNDQLLISLKKS